jgi:hypothetical protein
MVVTVAACANVTDGPGGSGGMGGAGGAPLLMPVLVAEPMSFAAEPPIDSVDEELGLAGGRVEGSCDAGKCMGSDPADRWSFEPNVSGEHQILLTWASVSSDLDLFLTDTNGAPLDSSTTAGTDPELITSNLSAGREYIIQVQVFNTFDATQAYTLQVTRTE